MFRENLIRSQSLERGLQENATVIVNSCKSLDEMRDELQLHSGTIYVLDAATIALDTHSRLNMPMMAMLAHVLSFPEEAVVKKIKETWPQRRRGQHRGLPARRWPSRPAGTSPPTASTHWSSPPKCAAPSATTTCWTAGRSTPSPCSTVVRNNAYARSNPPPVFDREACIDCAKCLTVCADPGAIVWKDGKMAGIDLSYCKACLRCVEVCPETKKGKALKDPQGRSDSMRVLEKAKQKMFLGNGNDAAAQAILHIGYDGEGYYPITPSSEVGEIVSKAVADGKSDISFVIGTSELAAIGICTGMAAGRRPRGGRHLRAGPAAEGGRAALHLRPGPAHGAQPVHAARSTRR